MENEQRLINAFYNSFWLFFALMIILLALMITFLVLRNHIFPTTYYGKYANIIKYLLIIVMFIGFIISTYFFSIRVIDLKAVRNQEFVYVKGEVVRFVINREGNDPTEPIRRYPLIRIGENEELIMLRLVDSVEIGEEYDFIYLNHSKISVLDE